MNLAYSERFVADSTPLMRIELLPGTYDLYRKLFTELHISSEVADELAKGPQLTPDEYLNRYNIAGFCGDPPGANRYFDSGHYRLG